MLFISVRSQTMIFIINCIILFSVILFINCSIPPQCGIGHDTFGLWRNSKSINQSQILMNLTNGHFIRIRGDDNNNNILTALHYTQIWIPHNCSYHRFTNETIQRCVDIIKKKKKKKEEDSVHIIFMGDSALRGIFCGLTRILSGSEIYGPCINTVCGGLPNGKDIERPKTISNCYLIDYFLNYMKKLVHYGKFFDIQFHNLKLTFVYVTKFSYKHLVISLYLFN